MSATLNEHDRACMTDWEVTVSDERGGKQYAVRSFKNGNYPICDVFYVNERGERIANLIAAAPTMLDELKALRELLDDCGFYGFEAVDEAKARLDRTIAAASVATNPQR